MYAFFICMFFYFAIFSNFTKVHKLKTEQCPRHLKHLSKDSRIQRNVGTDQDWNGGEQCKEIGRQHRGFSKSKIPHKGMEKISKR